MKWGLLLTTAKPPHITESEVIQSTLEFAKLGDELGYDSAWLLEHHFTEYGICPDPFVLAANIFGCTKRIEVGTAVVVAPLHHPIRVIENAALLDQLSKGRFHLGLGRGGFPKDFEVFQRDAAASHEMLFETVDIIRSAWSSGVAEADGSQYRFSQTPFFPKPYSTSGPPIYVAAESPSTVRWAASKGIPLQIATTLEDEETMSRMELYNETAEDSGFDVDKIPHMLMVVAHVGDTKDEAKRAVLQDLEWWGEEANRVGMDLANLKRLPNYSFHLRRLEQAVLEGRTTRDFKMWDVLDKNPVGTAEQCIERLEILKEISGAHHIVLGFEGAGDRKQISENIARFSQEVLPFVS